MNRILVLASVVLATVAIAACSSGIYTLGHQITFDSNGIVVHASGHPNAHVSRDGSLNVDGRTIAVTPKQRQLLQQYYQQASGVLTSGEVVGKQGVQMAARGIGDAIASIFHGNASTADKRMNATSQHIEVTASKLCTNIQALNATQHAIAVHIPAFAPYATGDELKCTITRGTPTTQGAGVPASASTTVSITVQ